MKTVFNNPDCATIWATLSQPAGHSRSMKFEGRVAYSYHTPVAHLIHNRLALLDSREYSKTTMRHLFHYSVSLSRLDKDFFRVPDIFPKSHDVNLAYFESVYNEERDRAMRFRHDHWRLTDDLAPVGFESFAHSALAERQAIVAAYCAAFNLRPPTYPWQADGDRAVGRADRLRHAKVFLFD